MKRVILVEDDSAVAAYFSYVLEKLGGFTVDRPSTGEDTLRLALNPCTVVVLVDATLRFFPYRGSPIEGVEVARMVKTQSANLPVVLTSARVMPGDRDRFLLSSRADAFLAKPLENHQQLLDTVANLTATHARRRNGRGD